MSSRGPRQAPQEFGRRAAAAARRLIADRRNRARSSRRPARRVERTGPAGSPAAGNDGLGYLFIITYGRSGSTLLQGILCSIPGYLVRGENREAVYHLYKFHTNIVTELGNHKRGKRLTPRHPFFGLDGYDPDAALPALRAFVLTTLLRPEPDTRIVGFKEIRWFQPDWKEYLDFLRELFPGARFIINTRDTAEVLASKWWATAEDGAQILARNEALLTEIAEHLGEAAFRVHYDDWAGRPEVLAPLFAWLGEPFDAMRVADVMAVKHSY
jgi:hypothetical protein